MLRKWHITNNLGLKLWSLTIAIILWYVVQEEARVSAFIDVDVTIQNRPTHLVITNTVTDKISLLVDASQSGLNTLREKPLPAYTIDLTNAVAGSALFKVYDFDFELPNDMRIERINPQLITVVLEEQKSKLLPVHINFTGALEDGIELMSSLAQPPQVQVIGPESEVETMQEIYTREVDLTGLRTDQQLMLPLLFKNAVTTLDPAQAQVQVVLKLTQHQIERTISKVPVQIEGADSAAWMLKPATIDLLLRGPAGMVHAYQQQPPKVFVTLSSISQTNVRKGQAVSLRVQSAVLPPCELRQIVPSTVQVALRERSNDGAP